MNHIIFDIGTMENTHKQLTALNAHSIRSLVDSANEIGIQKEDVLKLMSTDDGYYLLYYQERD